MAGRVITCKLHNGSRKIVFSAPNMVLPGSDAARAKGCTCPSEQPDDPNQVSFSTDCPVHELGMAGD